MPAPFGGCRIGIGLLGPGDLSLTYLAGRARRRPTAG